MQILLFLAAGVVLIATVVRGARSLPERAVAVVAVVVMLAVVIAWGIEYLVSSA